MCPSRISCAASTTEADAPIERSAPQFSLTKLTDDVARLRRVLARQEGPTVLVGHSYGCQIITALGEDAPNVVGLVCIAGFALDEGESIAALLGQGPPTPSIAHLDYDEEGFAWLPEDDFLNHFAADVDPSKARVMHAVQQPLNGSAWDEVRAGPSGQASGSASTAPAGIRITTANLDPDDAEGLADAIADLGRSAGSTDVG